MTNMALQLTAPARGAGWPAPFSLTSADLVELCQLWVLVEGAALRDAPSVATRLRAGTSSGGAASRVGRHVALHLELVRRSSNAQYVLVLGDVLAELEPYLLLAEQLDPEVLARGEAAVLRALARSGEAAAEQLGAQVRSLQAAVSRRLP